MVTQGKSGREIVLRSECAENGHSLTMMYVQNIVNPLCQVMVQRGHGEGGEGGRGLL